MNTVDTPHNGPATPIFDTLLAEAGLSWVDAGPAASGEQHTNEWFCADDVEAAPRTDTPAG
ncbi:hypothetical protein [Amycolatopsis sp. SID8362]|uniref:hypothetical protein n=1 Tax=Amycolatopsis sp. SID8362 TaxID=2690346 RepID=UPI00136F5854|nr:hypothetical protein [Amycolatopsis sp. SID8362]NBH09025.1 hypothetical protein [Amycolatopsis sp. SID8362]NED45717.1 hypothetical protein [Amycolatopsis sp. SID8362]